MCFYGDDEWPNIIHSTVIFDNTKMTSVTASGGKL